MRIIYLQERATLSFTSKDLQSSGQDDFISLILPGGKLVLFKVDQLLIQLNTYNDWRIKGSFQGSHTVSSRSPFFKILANKDAETSAKFIEKIKSFSGVTQKVYSISDQYTVGDIIHHCKFGEGVVASKIQIDKIIVLFIDGSVKTLVHSKK